MEEKHSLSGNICTISQYIKSIAHKCFSDGRCEDD